MSATLRALRLPLPLEVLLIFVPVSAWLHFTAHERHVWIFASASLAILPLAAYIGRATEVLATRFGGGIGGLMNATFGNAVELIIGALALKEGLPDLVKASLTGSIIGNVLLVFGLSAFVGGLKRPVQRFNRTAASIGTTMLLLSAVGLVVPAVFHSLARNRGLDLQLDTEIAIVLLVTYALSLVFTLHTHRDLYATEASHDKTPEPVADVKPWIVVLLVATAVVGVVSEFLVGAVSASADELGMTQLFVGVVVVAIIGNAAEHFAAVTLAAQDEMDAAIGIAVGSSTQIALFVAPVLVLLSYVIAPQPMDLLFTVFEVVAIAISVFSISFIAHDGETNWMEGVQLLAIYVILALGFYFLP